MVDDVLPYYNKELAYIRRLAGEFADAHPKIAGRLRLSADAVEDPHVARLIEAFALLSARVRLKIEDSFPELTDALLGVLYPHYLAPIPSMAIARFAAIKDLSEAYRLDAGTMIDTEAVGGERCRFQTAYPVDLWPIEVTQAVLSGRPYVAPPNPAAGGAVACLRLQISCLSQDTTFGELGPERLRFFLRGQPHEVFPLYELIFNNVVSVALADGPGDQKPVLLGPDAIRPVGFEADEGLLPYGPRTAPGYRLLTEYFAFPEKFLFFDLIGLDAKLLLGGNRELEIFLYLDRTSADLERSVSPENFALGCTPIVNLFPQRAEPIAFTQMRPDYRVVPDSRRPTGLEVWSIDRVVATDGRGDRLTVQPFFGIAHHDRSAGEVAYWHSDRRPGATGDEGTEVFLDLVDLDYERADRADWTLSVETTCLNRDIPARLPYGGGHPKMTLVEAAAPVAGVSCLTAPTATLRPASGGAAMWRLISHLSLNHLSLAGPEATDALREILKLYDYRDSAETRALIDSIVRVSSRRGAARVPGHDAGTICRGYEVTIEFDDAAFSQSGAFLLSAVLDRFLGLYCSINSYTRLNTRVRGRSGDLRKWPARAGDRATL